MVDYGVKLADGNIYPVYKWDERFLNIAENISHWSKDPSTKVGAVIANGKNFVSAGYNGFPIGIADDERLSDRERKYELIVHGEMNAIILAGRHLHGFTLYTYPFLPCSRCAAMVIQTGISRVVAPVVPEHLRERWEESLKLTRSLFDEAGVEWTECESLT